jgi:hypothetical protein
MERLEDIPSLPGQPTLTLDELANATKVKRKKIVAAADPVFAKVPAATSRRVGPVLPPATPTTREIFTDSTAKQKLKGKTLYKKASDVVDDHGGLAKSKASWLIHKDDKGSYTIPEKYWSGIEQTKNPAAANTALLNADGNIRQRHQKVRKQGHDAAGRFTAADSQTEFTKLGKEMVYRARAMGEGWPGLGGLQRKNEKALYLEWIEKTVSTMKNNQTMFEEGVRDVAATAMRKIQKEMNDLTQQIRRLDKHAALLGNHITELGGEAPEMEQGNRCIRVGILSGDSETLSLRGSP